MSVESGFVRHKNKKKKTKKKTSDEMHAPLTYEWAWHSVMGGGFVGLPRKWQMHAATRYELCPFWLQIHQRFIPTNPL